MKAIVKLGLLGLFVAVALSMVGCGPKYPNCKDDEHCKEKGEFCVNQKCVECGNKDHCVAKTGDACMTCGAGNTCVKAPGCCHSDLDCPGGKCWMSEGAEVGQCGGMCKNDTHCPEGFQCIGEKCVKEDNGCEDTGCPPGKVCKNKVCEWSCDMRAIYFDFNEAVLTRDAKATMEGNVECAKTLGVPVKVEGHCDERGTDEYNLALGERRAKKTMQFLKDRGVTTPLSKISYGEERPVCSDSYESCWSRNRRAEFGINQ